MCQRNFQDKTTLIITRFPISDTTLKRWTKSSEKISGQRFDEQIFNFLKQNRVLQGGKHRFGVEL